MRIWITFSGLFLVAVGLLAFAWKVFALDLPLLPDEPAGLWQVGVRVTAVPDAEEFSLQVAMPTPSSTQYVFGEQFSSGSLRLGVRDDGLDRRAVWRGTGDRARTIDLAYRVSLSQQSMRMPLRDPRSDVPADVRDAYGARTTGLPADSKAIAETLGSIELPPDPDVGGRVRSVYSFVVHETHAGESSDPLLVLRDREGSPEGREALLATLLRGAGVPTRVVRGLELHEPTPHERVWCEAWVDGWVPISATNRFLGTLPPAYLTLGYGQEALVSGSGLADLDYQIEAIQERLSPQEVANLMTPSDEFFSRISLHQLPVGLQAALRILLLMPVGALFLTVLRNIVGFPSYGTFMPMLIALALRGTGLGVGLLLIGMVLLIGVSGRLLVTKLRLLLVPRLSFLLCVVVISVAALAMAGFKFDERDFYAGLVFPIVILTMLVERFSITLSEEGLKPAALRAGSSIILAVSLYPLFNSKTVEHIMFSFPECVLIIMGILVWIGGYTGYRVSDILRFRPAVSTS